MAEPLSKAPAPPASALRDARATPTAGREAQLLAAEYPNLGYLVLRGRAGDDDFLRATRRVLGMALPLTPGTLAQTDAGVALWQSPDEWWLACPRHRRDETLAALTEALAGCFSQVVDNSGGLTALHIEGPPAIVLLRHLSPYDFDGLAPGRCVTTVVGKAVFTVARTGATGATLLFRRSFAAYVWDLIDRAALPYGIRLVPPEAAPDGLLSPLLS